jgi:hydrogenase maturation protease
VIEPTLASAAVDASSSRNRVLVACVGNVLCQDDGFGVAVAGQLAQAELPANVDLIETGIGGLSIVQQLMDGYELLIVVDAIDRGDQPGTVWLVEPSVDDPRRSPAEEWQAHFSNLHLAEPGRVFALARALGVLPSRVMVVGCQPLSCEGLGEPLSEPVERAVHEATNMVLELLGTATASPR